MAKLLQHEIERLKNKILGQGAAVMELVQKAVISIEESNSLWASEVVDADTEIDRSDNEIEEECLKVLALHQPVAIDLRFIVAVLKINSDLERIGDLAVNIAEDALYLATQEKINIPFDFPAMAHKAQTMLKNSLESLVNMDAEMAQKVCLSDDEVDAINRDMYKQVQNGIRRSPDRVEALIHLLAVSRHLERIADHATNIAEDVLYMIEGQIVRHKTEDYLTQH